MSASYWCEYAWLPPGEVVAGVRIETRNDRISAVEQGTPPQPGDQRRPGLTLPGFANVHSHAFHRALRGRTQDTRGSFWSWRDRMYELAGTLDPDAYHRLARRVYAEMRAVGISQVGEFHYLHHDPDGVPYADPNAFGHALIAAAREAGVRITLLDTCYLTGGIGQPLHGVQRRFSDGNADRWADRVERLAVAYADATDVTIGAAIHSVRAVPPAAMAQVAAWAYDRSAPLHVHLSEQPGENEDCVRAHGLTPTRLLYEQGVLGPATTVVHATHLTPDDIRLLGDAGANVACCPTTEADLADGIGPAGRLESAGATLTVGSDGHAVIDLLGEVRALEWNERLHSGIRGHWTPDDLVRIATEHGHQALGHADGGMLTSGSVADLVTLSLTDRVIDEMTGELTGGPLEPAVLTGMAVFAAGQQAIRAVRVAGSSP